MYALKQSTALTIPFFAHDTSGAPVTGLLTGDWTKRIKKASAAWAAMTVTVTETEGGWYDLVMTTAHTDTAGLLTIYLTATGAAQVNLQWMVTVAGEGGANLTHIDGLSTAGNLATLHLKSLDIYNPAGTAVSVAADGGSAVYLEAINGAGLSIWAEGVDYPAILVQSDESSGVQVFGGGAGDGIYAIGGAGGKALSDTVVDSILDRAIDEPSTIWSWPGSLRKVLGFIGALSRNKITQTNTTQSVYLDDESVPIATSTHSDDGSTHTRGEFF